MIACPNCGLPGDKHSSRSWCVSALRAELEKVRHAAQAAQDRRDAAPNGAYLLADCRDVFAAKALASIILHNNRGVECTVTDRARTAYEYADAMLTVRKEAT